VRAREINQIQIRALRRLEVAVDTTRVDEWRWSRVSGMGWVDKVHRHFALFSLVAIHTRAPRDCASSEDDDEAYGECTIDSVRFARRDDEDDDDNIRR